MNQYVELTVLEVSQSISLPTIFILILQQRDGVSKLPIIVGSDEAQQIKLRTKGTPKIEWPMLPDLLKKTTHAFEITLNYVLIHKIEDGIYFAQLHYQQGDESRIVEARTSDAIILALTYDCPIYIIHELLEHQHMREQKDGMISFPINALEISVLKEALRSAIAHENYELASQLRDEIKRRK